MLGSYEIITIVDGKTDSDEISSVLADVSSGHRKNDIKLVNYFQEMPISYGTVDIDECSGGVLEITAHQNQTVVIAHQKQTILKSKHFPDGLSVHAIAENVNLKKSCVALGRFAYVRITAERRNAVRVRLQESIQVTVKTHSAVYTGILADISVSGIKIKNSGLPSNPANALINISFTGINISLSGTFLREKIDEDGQFHVFTIDPDNSSEGIISKLIYVRQVEIIQMLKDQLLER